MLLSLCSLSQVALIALGAIELFSYIVPPRFLATRWLKGVLAMFASSAVFPLGLTQGPPSVALMTVTCAMTLSIGVLVPPTSSEGRHVGPRVCHVKPAHVRISCFGTDCKSAHLFASTFFRCYVEHAPAVRVWVPGLIPSRGTSDVATRAAATQSV